MAITLVLLDSSDLLELAKGKHVALNIRDDGHLQVELMIDQSTMAAGVAITVGSVQPIATSRGK
jgi:hypothetical protein